MQCSYEGKCPFFSSPVSHFCRFHFSVPGFTSFHPEWSWVVIAQIKCGFKILKPWYGCVIADSCTLSDPYDELVEDSSGDGGLPLADKYLGVVERPTTP